MVAWKNGRSRPLMADPKISNQIEFKANYSLDFGHCNSIKDAKTPRKQGFSDFNKVIYDPS